MNGGSQIHHLTVSSGSATPGGLVLRTVSVCLVLAACQRTPALSVGPLDRPEGIAQLLGLSARARIERLGAHGWSGLSQLRVVSGERHDLLEETLGMVADGRGGRHLIHFTSHAGNESRAEGWEAYFLSGEYLVRPRYGPLVRRRPLGDEVERASDDLVGTGRGYWEVLGRFVQPTVDGEVKFEGRPAVQVRLMRAAEPRLFEEDDPAHAWRQTIGVDLFEGELLVDRATGVLLSERYQARYRSRRGEHDLSTEITFHAQVEEIGQVPPVGVPEGVTVVDAPARPRPLLDRQRLLEGLASRRGEAP